MFIFSNLSVTPPESPLCIWFIWGYRLAWMVDVMLFVPGADEDRFSSVAPVEKSLREQQRGEGGRAASLRRFTHVQTLPASAELVEQFHYRE